MLIQQIIYGTLAIIIGTITLKYNFQIVNNTSRLEWIESKLGAGSTYLVYKLLSLLLIFGGILYLTGFGDDALEWLLRPIANLFPR
ncbi:MAG TPA: hypothetical protein VK963_02815 [Candidatus Saccharimonadales bacterium]|nr:hypothetical protein [Candidatus Saccharimonadales bacterium]